VHFQVDIVQEIVELRLGVEHLDALRVSVVTYAERPGNGVGIFAGEERKATMKLTDSTMRFDVTYIIFSMALSKLSDTK
jgi:hypothetical protein